jgi:hypothetical protein
MIFSLFQTSLQVPCARYVLEQFPLANVRDVFPETRCVRAGRGVSLFVATFARLSDLFVVLCVGRVDGLFDHPALQTS